MKMLDKLSYHQEFLPHGVEDNNQRADSISNSEDMHTPWGYPMGYAISPGSQVCYNYILKKMKMFGTYSASYHVYVLTYFDRYLGQTAPSLCPSQSDKSKVKSLVR